MRSTRAENARTNVPALSTLAFAVQMAAEGFRSVAEGEFLLASARFEAYGKLVARDSLITSLQLLSAARLHPTLAPQLLPPVERTLRTLASFQGMMQDPWTEEEPGKILHEYNPGPGGDFPGAYYASIDSTPLFLVALHEYERTRRSLGHGDSRREGEAPAEPPYQRRECGSPGGSPSRTMTPSGHSHEPSQTPRRGKTSPCPALPASPRPTPDLLEEFQDSRDRALAWILERADLDGDGLVEFLQRNPQRKSLINQNWKDSRDSLLAADGSTPAYPVAYAEVQSYCYRAVLGEAELRKEKDRPHAEKLVVWATRLAEAFEHHYWMPEVGCYAQALDAKKQQMGDLASNAFHWLWLGPVETERFPKAARRLLARELMTPFGLRTLSSSSPNYAPLRYHRGTIWPWDNWVAATALRRLGMIEAAEAIDSAVLRALTLLGCPAELYVYHDGDPGPSMSFFDWWGKPTHSCRIQAWTVGYLVEMVARRGAGGELARRLQDQGSASTPTTRPKLESETLTAPADSRSP